MTNSSPLAREQERLRQMAMQELRIARETRSQILYFEFASSLDRAQANADWYAAIRKAAQDGILSPREIQEAAIISRQRYHQITRTPRTSAPLPATEVQLPKEDV